jgi:hypothetical protein
LACALGALAGGPAAAEPGSGPHQTIDQTFTATLPSTPTGLGWAATYHAAGDSQAPPPAMEKMIFYPPAGFRYDTSVPEQCAATDAQLSAQGPSACPEGSRLGEGTTEGLFLFPFAHDYTFDHFTHHLDVLNNANEQILLVESEGWTIVRGKFQPDGSLVFASTTCFPASPTGECPDDYIIQLGSSTTIPPYTNAKGSYAATPPTCPRTRNWETTVRFWWTDGTTDSVVTTQPCGRKG